MPLWEAQIEIQRIHREVIEPELEKQSGEDFISVSFTPDELKAVSSFFDFFAYD